MKKLYSIILLTVMLCAATNLQASNEEGTVTEPQEDRILTIDPEAGSKLAGFVKGSTLTFTTTFDEKSQGMSISIIDLKKKELGLTTDYIVDKEYTTEKDEEGRWMVKFYSNIEFMKGPLPTDGGRSFRTKREERRDGHSMGNLRRRRRGI